MTFAILITSKEALAFDIRTKEGSRFWVTYDSDEQWSTTGPYCSYVPRDVKLFYSEKKAFKFMEEWNPHPWRVVPKSFEVVRLKPVYRKMISHYEVA